MTESDPVESLREVLEGLSLQVAEGSAGPFDLSIDQGDGRVLQLEVKSSSLVTEDTVRRLRATRHHFSGAVPVLVANRITGGARRQLADLGWGWLDLRGHIHLKAPGLYINTEIEPHVSAEGRTDPLAGAAGLEVACMLMARPTENWSIRGIARAVHRAPSTVSEIVRGFRTEGLVTEDLRPDRELFWRVADRWPNRRVFLERKPTLAAASRLYETRAAQGSLEAAFGLGTVDVEESVGWALTDTMAAIAYRVPVFSRKEAASDFFVPTEGVIRRARTLLGEAVSPASAAASVRVAPVPAVCSTRVDGPKHGINEDRPLAAPLYVALDLAQDAGRGRELLESWDPGRLLLGARHDLPGWVRVW